MCGIAGTINFNQNQVKKEDLNLMKHRGPDDKAVFIDNNIGLGFIRLSILDLSSAGHQPMFSHDKRYIIIFNGETKYMLREAIKDILPEKSPIEKIKKEY